MSASASKPIQPAPWQILHSPRIQVTSTAHCQGLTLGPRDDAFIDWRPDRFQATFGDDQALLAAFSQPRNASAPSTEPVVLDAPRLHDFKIEVVRCRDTAECMAKFGAFMSKNGLGEGDWVNWSDWKDQPLVPEPSPACLVWPVWEAEHAGVLDAVLYGSRQTEGAIARLQQHPNLKIFVSERVLQCLNVRGQTIPSRTARGYNVISDSNPPRNQRVLCVSPHPDDSVLTAGGFIHFLSRHDNRVATLVATDGERSEITGVDDVAEKKKIRRGEAEAEAGILHSKPIFGDLPLYGAKYVGDEDVRRILKVLNDENPDMVIVPFAGDAHATHRLVSRATLEAVKDWLQIHPEKRLTLLCCETTWGQFGHGEFNTFVVLQNQDLEAKIEGAKAHASQCERTPFDEYARHMPPLRGAVDGELYLTDHGQAAPNLGAGLERFRRLELTVRDIDTKLQTLLERFEREPCTLAAPV